MSLFELLSVPCEGPKEKLMMYLVGMSANLRLTEIRRNVAQSRGEKYEESKESESEKRRRADWRRDPRGLMA